LKVASESGSGGNAYDPVEIDVVFHEKIKEPCGKKSPHGAPFKNESC
jgi:hypothetical protein